MKLTIGFSPCPNDTFIFEALVTGKIDTGHIQLEPVLEDVETLNEWATAGKLDITKLSFPAYFKNKKRYALLNAGAALGQGVGPLLVTNRSGKITPEDIEQASIVLPGAYTTANLLFSYAYPKACKKEFAVFHTIEDALVSGAADFGVIIHENRFTYQDKGLIAVADLGAHWETQTKMPVPLGGIFIKKEWEKDIGALVNDWIYKSLCIAYTQQPPISDYVRRHAQAMREEVMQQHIQLYVNEYSLNLGAEGLQAIHTLGKVFATTV